jgi:hypothetical protein
MKKEKRTRIITLRDRGEEKSAGLQEQITSHPRSGQKKK